MLTYFLGFIAKKLCPELVIVPVNMKKYAEVSEVIREVFRSVPIRVSKFSKNLFREIFEAHSKIIYFREISTIFIIIFAKFSNQFSRKFSNKFSRK